VAKFLRPRDKRAVAGDFIVLYRLRGPDPSSLQALHSRLQAESKRRQNRLGSSGIGPIRSKLHSTQQVRHIESDC
jgi:hypothetical protein